MTRPCSVTTIGLCVLFALSLGCDSEKGKEKTSNETSTSTSAREQAASETTKPSGEDDSSEAKETSPKAEKPPTKSAPKREVASKNIDRSRELNKQYREHLREGRKLVQGKKYKEGLEVFEKALAIDPNNARILSEIGWAAYLAGDYERSIQANNDSVRFAKEDKLKGASLYNLGRVAEAQKDTSKAATYYERSLIFRENKTVRERLASVKAQGGGDESEKKDLYTYFGACTIAKLGADLESGCREMALGVEPEPRCFSPMYSDSPTKPEIKKVTGGTKLTEYATFVMSLENDMTDYHMLAFKYDGSWYATSLVWVYNPGAFGIFEDLHGLEVSIEQLVPGGEPEIIVRTEHGRHDTDMGLDEEEDVSTEEVTVLGIHDGKPMLMLDAVEAYTYYRGRIGAIPDDELPRDLVSDKLPIKSKSGLSVTFDKKGNVTLGKKDGFTPSEGITLGTRALIDGEKACKE